MAREALITEEGLEKLKTEIEHLSTDQAPRGRRHGSRRRASSATSPRTPSTTTRRTSRRCSSSASPSSRSGCAARTSSTRRRSTPSRSASASIVHVKDQKSGDSRKFQIVGSDRGQPGGAQALATSRRSARRCSATSAATSSPSTSRAGRRRSSRSRRSKRPSGLALGLGSPAMAEPEEQAPSQGDERPESHVLAERREKLERLRGEGVEPYPHQFEGRTEIADRAGRARGARGRRGDREQLPRRGADRRAPGPRQGRVHRPRRRQRADPAALARRRGRRATRTSCSPGSTSATSSGSRGPYSRPGAASSR